MHRFFAAVVFMILPLAMATADEVFLLNGFVYRNVRVVDSTAATMRISFNGKGIDIQRDMIDHIERRGLDNSRKAEYEMYSAVMSKAFVSARLTEEERIQQREQARRDSARALERRKWDDDREYETYWIDKERKEAEQRVRDSLDWRAHGYDRVLKPGGWNCAIGLSHPLGYMGEAGVRLGSVAFSLVLSGSDAWSAVSSEEMKLGLACRIHLWKYVGPFDPYLGFIAGTALGSSSSSQGAPENYITYFVGTGVLLTRSVALTMELGFARTSRYLPWHYERNSLVNGDQVIDHPYLRVGVGLW